jgi:ribose transport system permease protein
MSRTQDEERAGTGAAAVASLESTEEMTAAGGRSLATRRFDPRALTGRYAVVLTLVAMVLVFSLLRPDTFFTMGNFKAILVTQSVLIILALGLTITLAVGEFDLSIASMLGFSGGLVAYLSSDVGWSVGAALGVSFLAALAIGALNGLFVVVFRVSSFITTLGMGTLILGLALAITGSTVIGNLPPGLTDPARTELLGLDLPVFYALLFAVALWYLLEHTPLGRYLFFTGEGPEAARLAGIRVDRIRFGALVASSVCAWLAGVLLVGQTGAADPTFGSPFLLPAFAAAFLGATTIKPGRFNAWGTVVAVLLLATGTTGLQLLGAADWVENVFNGAALILAVTLARLVSRET